MCLDPIRWLYLLANAQGLKEMKALYKDIPEGSFAIIVYPNITAMIYGIWRIGQDKNGDISAADSDGETYNLGQVLDAEKSVIDIQKMRNDGLENYLISVIAPLCSNDL